MPAAVIAPSAAGVGDPSAWPASVASTPAARGASRRCRTLSTTCSATVRPNRASHAFGILSEFSMVMGNVVMTQALRNAGVAASGHGFRSSFKGWAREHDVDELLSEFALAHVEGSATVAAYARDDLLEKRRPVMQAWADCISR